MTAHPGTRRRRAAPERGAALLFAMAIMLLLTVAGLFLIHYAGEDRVDAAKLTGKDRALACADAGLQYARSFFGSRYEDSNNWNAYLVTPTSAVPGYRYDANAGDPHPSLDAVPRQARGYSDGVTLDPTADIDGDHNPDFWVSVHDDDDERPLGLADDPTRDNNEVIVIRSECTSTKLTIFEGGSDRNVVLEATLSHVQGSSGYGTAAGGSNSADLVGSR